MKLYLIVFEKNNKFIFYWGRHKTWNDCWAKLRKEGIDKRGTYIVGTAIPIMKLLWVIFAPSNTKPIKLDGKV